MSDGRFGSPRGKPRNRVGERVCVTIPDSELSIGDDETPPASLTTPSAVVDLGDSVRFMPAVPAGERSAAVPERWQVAFTVTEVGMHLLAFAGQVHEIDVDDTVNPKANPARRRGARTKAEARAAEGGS